MNDINGFDIVLVIAIILFARLGMRLLRRFIQDRKNKSDKDAEDIS